jgi:hypothetical protein
MTLEELIEKLEQARYHLTSHERKAVIDDAIDTLKKQQAEIERLKRTITGLSLYYKDLANFEKIYTDETARYAFKKAERHTKEMMGDADE